MTELALCVMRHRERPRRALPAALICRRHDDAIREDLADIATLYPLLSEVAEPGSVAADELTRYAKRPDPAAPVRLEVVTLRDARTTWDPGQPDAIDVLGVLAAWATIVRDDMRLTAAPSATIASEIQTLTTQHDFVIAQAWVDEYAGELHRAAVAVRHACGEYDRAPDVGSCPVLSGDAPCGGRLFPDRYGLMKVRCARCGEVWDEDDLRRLGLVLES